MKNKFKPFFIGLLMIALPLMTVGKELTIKRNLTDQGESCEYKALRVDEFGKIELEIKNYDTCIQLLSSGGVLENEDPTTCQFNNKVYEKGEELVFYKSETSCSDAKNAICGSDKFPPDGYTAINCNDKESDIWAEDIYNIGDNQTSPDLYGGAGSPEGYIVRTLDGGGRTAVPGCANNIPFYNCSDWTNGAKRNEVYAVREERTISADVKITFTPNRSGIEVQNAIYEVTISPNPGQMKHSDFVGKGCVGVNNKRKDFTITLISDRNYEKYKDNLSDTSCYVPQGEKYYINIRAASPTCDTPNEMNPRGSWEWRIINGIKIKVLLDRYGDCHSYYEVH